MIIVHGNGLNGQMCMATKLLQRRIIIPFSCRRQAAGTVRVPSTLAPTATTGRARSSRAAFTTRGTGTSIRASAFPTSTAAVTTGYPSGRFAREFTFTDKNKNNNKEKK